MRQNNSAIGRNWGNGEPGNQARKKRRYKTAAEFGWDTSKLQKITLFQARYAPLQRTTVHPELSRMCANFRKTFEIAGFPGNFGTSPSE
ncbi:MAG: hypothetical protein CMO10_03295 [Thalassospira sp.]|nr:hypothetical protein [Thalassospira sp.]